MYTSKSSTSRSYFSNSGDGRPEHRTQVTTTRTFIDEHGNKRTETTTHSGDDADTVFGKGSGRMDKIGGWDSNNTDHLGQRMGNISVSGPTVTQRNTAPTVETGSRYNKGWSSKKAVLPTATINVQGKKFAEIRDECLKNGCLFEDPEFPAVDKSIFYSQTPPRPFKWMRPSEICSDPQLFVGGASRFDVKQGELGDCWLLAAVACITNDDRLLHKVVPQDQSFTQDYAGIFHFQFWHYGAWVDVVIDDRLPTYNNRLVFMHSDTSNEFWTALLEKAYAKLNGSYESLKGGSTTEALEDFTGGISENFDFRQEVPADLFKIMLQAHHRHSLMGCSIEADPNKVEAELSNGLIMGHAYSITDVRMVTIKTSRKEGQIQMLRIRNPWGNECEWNGAWSDKSKEWSFIDDAERKNMGLVFDHDGEFWMAFQDFIKNFQKLEIVHQGVEAMEAGISHHWENKVIQGEWKRRVTAGGCRNYLETFWTNPQYQVEVVDVDDDDDEVGTLIVGLMQKDRRKLRKEGLDLLTMGYVVYKLPKPNPAPLDVNFFKYNASVAKSPAFINLREVSGRHKLQPGHYCIVPSTFEPGQEGQFLVRMYSEKPNNSSELDEQTGISDVQNGGRVTNGTAHVKGGPVTNGTADVPKVQLTEDDKKQDDSLRAAFKKVAGEDLEIDAYELKDILDAACKKEFTFDGFSNDTCRGMVAMLDVDHSGKLGFEEFKKLWDDIRVWKTVFKQFDADKSGTLNSFELRSAFHGIGFTVSNATFNCLVQRYAQKDGAIRFDDFIHCVVRMKTMFETFKAMKKTVGGKAEFALDEFIQTTMYS